MKLGAFSFLLQMILSPPIGLGHQKQSLCVKLKAIILLLYGKSALPPVVLANFMMRRGMNC